MGRAVDTSGLQESGRVYVTGSLQTVDGERVLMWPKVIDLGAGDSVRPLGLTCRSLSGGGLAPDCLLVRTWGRIVERDPASPATWFKIDDGSNVNIKCSVPANVTVDPGWTYLAVTGISSCENTDGDLHRLLRVRTLDNITPH